MKENNSSSSNSKAVGRKRENVPMHKRKSPPPMPKPSENRLAIGQKPEEPKRKLASHLEGNGARVRKDGTVELSEKSKRALESARLKAQAQRDTMTIVLETYKCEIHYHSGLVRRFQGPTLQAVRTHSRKMALESTGRGPGDNVKIVIIENPHGRKTSMTRTQFLSETEEAWVAREHKYLEEYRRKRGPVMKREAKSHTTQRCRQSRASFSHG